MLHAVYSSLLSVGVIKTMAKATLGWGRAYLAYRFQSTIAGSQDRSLELGTEAETTKERCLLVQPAHIQLSVLYKSKPT